jgi:phosphoglycerate dehydrogenase-like enzyme
LVTDPTHRLLIAASSYQRTRAAIDPAIQIVQLDRDGNFSLDGTRLSAESVQPTLIRLDWDMMQSGHMKSVVEIIRGARGLAFVQTSAAGLDNPLFRIVEEKARYFCNSDAQAPPIAEFVLDSVLNRWHRFDIRAAHQAARRWQRTSFKEMLESNWLIIGFGNIGQRIARQAKGFGANVTALRRNTGDSGPADRVDVLANMGAYLKTADVVVLACALNDETRGLANEAFFGELKKDAVLVNIARGDLIDEPALLRALDANAFDAAILDVFATEPLPEDHPFWTHERVVLTPHSSNAGLGTLDRGDALFLENLDSFLNQRPLRNLVQ